VRRRSFLLGGAGMLACPLPAFAQSAGAPAVSNERRFADYALGLRYDDIPAATVEQLKDHLLDALASGYAAIGTDPAKIAEATFRATFPGPGNVSLLGGSRPISVEGAALVNGVLIRTLDYNDIYFGATFDPIHPSDCIAAALACCEDAGASGRDLLAAIAVGYEAQIRMNDALTMTSRGFYYNEVIAVAVPLIAGRIWRMTADQIANAVAIAYSHQMTLLAVVYGKIGMMKTLPSADTALDALFDTRLAAAGFTGPDGVFDWVATHVQPAQKTLVIDFDPQHFSIGKVGFKRFPLQGQLQAVVEAAVDLAPQLKGRLASIRSIDVGSYQYAVDNLADPPKYHPETSETADHSLPICAAMALLDGTVTVKQFDDGRWKAPDVLALASKITVSVNAALIAKVPKGNAASMDVHLDDGTTLSQVVEVPEGDPAKPMSRASLEGKFRDSAAPVLGAAHADRIVASVRALDTLADVRSFTRALRA
jgi:2-methylcitrate dehydratase